MTAAPTIPADIFRAYDIRGIVGKGLNAEYVMQIGQAIGSEVLDSGGDNLYVARDTRLSSPELGKALITGILASGCNVINLGEVPTPLLYFAAYKSIHGCGAMLTGSHNPAEYNGIKVVLNKQALADDQISRLRQRIVEHDLHSGQGTQTSIDIVSAYLNELGEIFKLRSAFHVVIDCGNGVTGLVAPALFRSLGCTVTAVCCEPDGNFPNHHPDPTRAENLQMLLQAMQQTPADLGIAFDGDGDRVILISAEGSIIDADHMLMAFAKDILPEHPGASIVFDVKSSHLLARLISDHGGKPVMSKSGHSYVKKLLYESQALLGGEYSAHIFFRHRWYGFDDGMYTAIRFLELMDKYHLSAKQILDTLPVSASTQEIFIPVSEKDKFTLVLTLKSTLHFPDASMNYLDGIRAEFTHGWALIRASNTTPNLVLRFEADDEGHLQMIQKTFHDALRKLLPTLSLPF